MIGMLVMLVQWGQPPRRWEPQQMPRQQYRRVVPVPVPRGPRYVVPVDPGPQWKWRGPRDPWGLPLVGPRWLEDDDD